MRQGLKDYAATLSGDGDTDGGTFLDTVETKLGTCDRKEDEELGVGAIEEAIEKGSVDL